MSLLRASWIVLLLAGLAGINAAAYLSYRPFAANRPEGNAPLPADDHNEPGPTVVIHAANPPSVLPLQPGSAVTAPVRPATPQPAGPDEESLRRQREAERLQREYESNLARGREALQGKRLKEAIAILQLILQVRPGDSRATELLAEARKRLAQFEENLARGQKALDDSLFKEAIEFLKAALSLVDEDTRASAALSKAEERLRQELARQNQLTGSVLVLVLSSKTTNWNDPRLQEGLKDLEKRQADKLLGRRIYCLTTKDCVPWNPASPPGRDESFENRDFDKLFQQAFQKITTLAERARHKDFKAILVWETDFPPDAAAGRRVEVPANREFRLCYRFTDRDVESGRLNEWFKRFNTARAKEISDLPKFVEFFVIE